MGTLDYNLLAAEYSKHRRTYPGLVEHILERSDLHSESNVLEIGCGTANHLSAIKYATGARCIGVDPSTEMLAEAAASPLDLELRVGTAEDLWEVPASLDLILSVDMLHYVRRPDLYFGAAFRSLAPGGLFCNVTESAYIIENRKPMAKYFPATVPVDLARYHPVSFVKSELSAAGFQALDEVMIESVYEVEELSGFEDRCYSNLHLISEQEYRSGLEEMRSDLANGPIPGIMRSTVLWAVRA
ncbi:class I SAM-dependent DNA methyltransferase [Nocardia sp. NPDC058640]|uniref:class I SAM-dependent DNA methyltransferase n=1 Tax=Nocardia sp. NPDC058640 TaxID=3346571 RepID=UPI003658CFE4